jgi:hypothetical protein
MLAERCAAIRPQTLPLDRSFESLDRVEDFLRYRPEHKALVTSYVGETLIAHAGGRWESPKVGSDDGTDPLITKLSIIPKARFYPSEVVAFALLSPNWFIRDAVEHHDIDLRQKTLAALVANLPAELEALRDDIVTFTGRTPPPFDDSSGVLATVEDTLVSVLASGRDVVRRVRNRVVLLLGELVLRKIGGEWSISQDTRNDTVGDIQAHGWSPRRVVGNVGPQNRGLFVNTLPLVYQRGRT